jgi:nitrous oxide reductase accessory protein NosL
MKRRDFLLAGTALVVGGSIASPVFSAEGDGTPMQFMPKTPKDPEPLKNDLEKYPKCPYCGMNRKEYHFSRHLIHYSDDLVDGTCSIHCAAISLSLNVDRNPKAIYAPDNGAPGDIKPLTDAEKATYVIGGNHRPVMSKTPKISFASKDAAEAAKAGGELANFDKALTLAYLGMAEDTKMIRMKREEKRKAAQHGGMKH